MPAKWPIFLDFAPPIEKIPLFRENGYERGARQHQAITWTNVDLSLVKCSDMHLNLDCYSSLRSEGNFTHQPSIIKNQFGMIHLNFHPNLPGADEFIKQTPLVTGYKWVFCNFIASGPDDTIQNGWRDVTEHRGISSVQQVVENRLNVAAY